MTDILERLKLFNEIQTQINNLPFYYKIIMLLPCEKFEFPFYFIWIFFSRVAEKKSRKTFPSKIIKNEQ